VLRRGRRVAGIGRCYASEIMWAARLAPFARTDRLAAEEWTRLADSADTVLNRALERSRARITLALPQKEDRLTAVHQHYGDPCLRCGDDLHRVSFSSWEMVYCARCQTGGKVYADRRMSRLLR
jgi:formamidopyrimidine-DNA glycosylase